MLLSKKDKKLFFSLFLIIILLTSGSTIRNFLPDELQKIIFEHEKTPENDVRGTKSENINNIYEMSTIAKVIDGDTIQTSDGKKIRYIGIDSPESQDPRKPVECFAHESTERNKQLVLGQVVRLEIDVSQTDRYGRLLRYIYIGNTMINEQLVLEGYALASSYPPDIKYQKRLKTAEKTARENNRGLWAVCNSNN